MKTEIKKIFKNTDIRGDGQVVVVKFKNQEVEVVPVFSNEDGTLHTRIHMMVDRGRYVTLGPKCRLLGH